MNFKPGLYIVSTPIGNLNDITLRAMDVLRSSNIIYCEDTRVSNKLLAKHQIKSSLRLYNDNSDSSTRNCIKSLILEGNVISLISDAGTPLISDPGYKLVRDLKEDNFHVDVIPGPCAAIAALTLSGLPTDRFYFEGFLPKTKIAKINIFNNLSNLKCSLIFYETANRLLDTLQAAYETFGDRKANVAREITKLFQESPTLLLSELITHYTNKSPKGEIVFIIHGASRQSITVQDLQLEIAEFLKGGMSAKSVCDKIFENYNESYSRKEIYKITNEVKATLA